MLPPAPDVVDGGLPEPHDVEGVQHPHRRSPVSEIPVEPGGTVVEVLVPGPQGPAGSSTGGVTPEQYAAGLAAAKARANHTGTQLAVTINDLGEAVQDIVSTLLVAGANIGLVYDDVANTLTISSTATGGGATDPGLEAGARRAAP